MTLAPDRSAAPTQDIIKALLVADDPVATSRIADLLREVAGVRYELETTHRLIDAVERITSFDFDTLLLDHELLRDGDDIETAQWCARFVPTVILSHELSEELAATCARAGAHDYLLHADLNAELLARTLRYSIERQRSRTALAEAEERYRSVFDNATSGIYRSTAAGRFQSVNPRLVSMLGYASADELLSTPISSLYRTPEERQRTIRSFLDESQREGVEVEWCRKDGAPLTVSLTGRPYNADHSAGGFEVFVEDISPRRRLEAQLFRSQRTEELGKLARGVAHDFNNLLGVIIGFGDLLLKELSLSDPRRSRAEEIHLAARRAATLTRQLLAFSRSQVLQPEPLDINGVLADIENLLLRVLGEDIELSVDPATDLWPVWADPSHFDQVIVNLATNARHAMPSGGALRITTRNVALVEEDAERLAMQMGDYVRLTVEDSGCGMDAEVLSRVFEPFFTTRGSDTGSGLGLATISGIVKQYQGCVAVKSTVDEGTTFEVYLPRFSGAGTAPRLPSVLPTAPPVVSPPVDSEPERILVVEDDEPLRMMITEILSSEGYDVLAFGESKQALDAAPSLGAPVHLLLTDVVMPRIGGREVAERLIALGAVSRVLFMSGYTDESVQDSRALEHSSFIQKPFTTEALLHEVRGLLDGPGLKAERP